MLLFTTTIFISAFLLFQIQPLISRYILPWFGGTPAVWSTAMLFFQALLLAGYAYAHRLSGRSRAWMRGHALLLGASLLFILISGLAWGAALLPDAQWKPPDSSQPFLRILLLLSASVGLPYFILSSTSPLLQSWFSFLYPGRSPYQLYALSNIGSFLALISYPILAEPYLTLPQQSLFWAAAFGLYALCTGILLWRVQRAVAGQTTLPVEAADQASPHIKEDEPRLPGDSSNKQLPVPLRKLLWVLLPACTTLLLLAVTNQLTQEVAVIPFLWILPLSVYLLSFTLAFSGENWYPRAPYLILFAVVTLIFAYAVRNFTSLGILLQIVIYTLFLLLATFIGHAELYRLRPEPRELTSFYLLVSLGGVIGGIFVNLVAPLLFRSFLELHLGVILIWILLAVVLIASRPQLKRPRTWVAAVLLLAAFAGSSYLLYSDIQSSRFRVLISARNFYGVFRVRQIDAGDPPHIAASLAHGITSHGFQYLEDDRRSIPTSYYGRRSGIGLAIQQMPKLLAAEGQSAALRVGVIGLGTGTIAAYGQPGDTYRFYEINPDIIDLAQGKYGYFTYLSDSPAQIELVAGDARISLEHELERGELQNFDILAIDAFSSDSIPVHLLTTQAFELYLSHLQPQGILAVHISNRYLDLTPLIQAQAAHFGLDLALIASSREGSGSYPAVWVLLSKNKAFFERAAIIVSKDALPEPRPDIRIWTDDYSNLLQFLRLDTFLRMPR